MQSTTQTSTTPTSTAQANPKPRGWMRRNWLRILVCFGVLIAFAAGGGYFYKFGRILISTPYRQAMANLRESPQVKKLLGEPISANWFPVGNVNNEIGEARMILKIHGPAGADGKVPTAEASILARAIEGEWGFTQFDVQPANGDRMNLVPEIEKLHPSVNDVKPYDPNAQPLRTAKAPPPPDVDIQVPDGSDSNKK